MSAWFPHTALALLLAGGVLAQETLPPVEELIRDLENGGTRERREAARLLSQRGEAAAPAVEALSGALEDDDTQVWFHSVTALSRIGPRALPALPALLDGMDSYRPGRANPRWYRSAHALGRMGPGAIERLRPALIHDNDGIRAGVAQALWWMGEEALPALPDLISLFGDEEEHVRRHAALAVGNIGEAALEPIRALLVRVETPILHAALTAVESMGHPAAPLAPDLVRLAAVSGIPGLAGDPTTGETTALALRALTGIGTESLERVIWPLFRHPAPRVQLALADAVLSRPPASAVPELIRLLEEPDRELRLRAATLLGRIGSEAAPAIPRLIRAIEEDPPHASPLADALVAMGPVAIDPLLARAASHDESIPSDHWVVDCLCRFGLPGLGPLQDGLASGPETARVAALHALGRMGRDARESLPEIERSLEADRPPVRAAALDALIRITPRPDEHRGAILRLLEDDSPEVLQVAVSAAGRLSAVDDPVLQRMSELLELPRTRKSALEALTGIGTRASGLEPGVSALLEEGDGEILTATLDCLGALGRVSDPTRERMLELARSGTDPVRHAALQALVRLDGDGERLLELFRQALESPHAGLRRVAITGLGRTSSDESEILEASQAALADPRPEVRLAAAVNLGRLEEKAVPATGPLLRLLSGPHDPSRYLAVLRDIPAHESQLDAYRSGLDDDSPVVRAFACERLGDLGDKSAAAIDRLRELSRRDTYSSVRREAREALQQITR